jgi:hypothetical protein
MTPLRKIVAPVDFSKNSRAGLRYAASLAAENQAELIVLYVANEYQAWEIPDELALLSHKVYRWEADKILREARFRPHCISRKTYGGAAPRSDGKKAGCAGRRSGKNRRRRRRGSG